MRAFTRREFLKVGGLLAAGAGLSSLHARVFAEGLEKLSAGRAAVLWLQGQSCSGCSVSLLNSDYPAPLEIITDMIALIFHQTLSAAQGDTCLQLLDKVAAETRDLILVVEGSLPAGMPEACLLGGRPFAERLLPLLRKARYVIGVGSCATYGGIPAAEGNPTGAVSVKAFMEQAGLPTAKVLVNCPSCPCHPDSIVGSLAWLASKGYPAVQPDLLTPVMYYAHSTHDDCPRFHNYSKRIFAQKFGDPGCLFQLGCLGMLSYTECPRRQWNGGVNWCIRAAAPCIGCTHPQFGKKKAFPFYRKGEANHRVAYTESDRKGGAE